MSVLARVLRIFVYAWFLGSGAFADAKPRETFANLMQPQFGAMQLDRMDGREGALRSSEPFDRPASAASAGETVAKWNELQPRIRADLTAIANCRSGKGACSAAAHRFLSIAAIAGGHQGRARLAWINRAVNLSVRPMSDWAQYGYADYWASPLQTLGSSAGDCEDYAIVKYALLRVLGVAPDDLRLVVVRDTKRETDHAVVAARDQGEWVILDNRTMATITASQDRQYDPLFVMDDRGVRAFATASVRR